MDNYIFFVTLHRYSLILIYLDMLENIFSTKRMEDFLHLLIYLLALLHNQICNIRLNIQTCILNASNIQITDGEENN